MEIWPSVNYFFSLKFEFRDFSTIQKKNIIGDFDENEGAVFQILCADVYIYSTTVGVHTINRECLLSKVYNFYFRTFC